MEFDKFLEEYKQINIEELEIKQLDSFREIFFNYGMLDEVLKISKVIYERDKTDENSIVSYVNNLMNMGLKDDALLVLFNSPKTARVLFLEGLIYKEDMLLDVAEEKFKQGLLIVGEDKDLANILEYELANVYVEVGKSDDALSISKEMFNKNKTETNLENLIDNLMYLGKFEEIISLQKEYEKKLSTPYIHYAVAYAYNQLEEFEKSKEELLKTIELDSEFTEAYMHLGFMSKGQEAINYLENYLELQGNSTAVYIQLINLYKKEKQYDNIRLLAREVLKNMGIDFDTLYIAISALRNLYEADKVYEIYNQHNLIKEDSSLLNLALLTLSEEEDYADFVAEEIKKHHPFLKETPQQYYEVLKNIYDITGDNIVKDYLIELENLQKENYNFNDI